MAPPLGHCPGHKCCKRLYNLEVRIEEVDETIDVAEIELMDVDPQLIKVEEPEPLISLNTMVGKTNFQTLKVNGKVGKRPILILVDSGSSHNFWMQVWQQS